MPDLGRLVQIAREDEPEAPDLALVPVQAGQMTRADQAKAAAGHAARRGWRKLLDARERPGTLAHSVYTGQPPSVRQQVACAESRAWVPPGHEDGLADVWGTRYQQWIAIPGVALGGLWIETVRHPARFAVALAVLLINLIPLAFMLGLF